MAPRWTGDPSGRITPGALLVLAALLGAGWFMVQPQADRSSLACQPLTRLSRWLTSDVQPGSPWDEKAVQIMESLTNKCPDAIGKPAASLSEQADQLLHATVTKVKKVADRHISAVLDGPTLKIAGLGPARLLGVTVLPEHQADAHAFLKEACEGKHLPVQVYAERDAEYYHLVVVELPREEHTTVSINELLLQKGYAAPWNLRLQDAPWTWHQAASPSP